MGGNGGIGGMVNSEYKNEESERNVRFSHSVKAGRFSALPYALPVPRFCNALIRAGLTMAMGRAGAVGLLIAICNLPSNLHPPPE